MDKADVKCQAPPCPENIKDGVPAPDLPLTYGELASLQPQKGVSRPPEDLLYAPSSWRPRGLPLPHSGLELIQLQPVDSGGHPGIGCTHRSIRTGQVWPPMDQSGPCEESWHEAEGWRGPKQREAGGGHG